jgi:hypothetical protein
MTDAGAMVALLPCSCIAKAGAARLASPQASANTETLKRVDITGSLSLEASPIETADTFDLGVPEARSIDAVAELSSRSREFL